VYEDWSADSAVGSEFTSFQKVNKCQSNILRFLAENGSCSIYDLTKQLKYRYPYIHENTNKLKNKEWVTLRKDLTGVREKKLVKLNFRGLTVFLIMWKEYTEEAKNSIQIAITRYQELFPFSKQWNKMKEIVGETLLQKLIDTARDIASGKHVKVKIDYLDLKFKAFIYRFMGSTRLLQRIYLRGKERDEKFASFLSSQDELKKAYISFLAIQDILDLDNGILEIDELTKFRSERELAFFEKRSISADPLFPKERLREIFPAYTKMKYVFTGSLIFRLLWKTPEKQASEAKKGFHVYYP